MSEFTKLGRIALWKQNVSTGDSKPMFTGNLEFDDGRKMKVSLWRSDNNKQNAPTMTGVIETEKADE